MPLGQELEKAACALGGGRTKQALTSSFDPLVRFTRFNRIEIWSLQVNANRYVNIFVLLTFWNFDFYLTTKLQNISETENMFHNIFTGCTINVNLGYKRMSGATGRGCPGQVKFKVSPL